MTKLLKKLEETKLVTDTFDDVVKINMEVLYKL